MKRMRFVFLLGLALALVASACSSDSDDSPPETVIVTVPGETTTETVIVEVTVPPVETADQITFWTTEKEPARVAITQDIVDAFTAKTGIPVKLTVTPEDALPQLMLTNAAAADLPDVVFHPLDFTVGWANAGLLDQDAAAEVIAALGEDTFSAGALAMGSSNGMPTAVPSDGWGQLLIYRTDLFEAAGLAAPDTFANIEAAAKALNDPGSDLYGITASTDPSAVFTQQTWEHFALANGCELIDDAGTVTLDSPNCVEAMEFYTNLISSYSPAGVQDVVSTRATYFAGQASMIVWSPFIMDEMAGLRDAALPTCPECVDNISYLAENSAFMPSFSGPSGAPAQYGQVSYMGIGMTENTDAAKQFVEFWLSDGYLDWLSTSPEGKFPMRRGTQDDPTLYIEGWRALSTGVDRQAPLADFYGEQVISDLIEGTSNMSRWGFVQGEGELVSAVYSTLIVPAAIDQVLGGTSVENAVAQMQADAVQEQEFLADAAG
jgi:multiple sugar transport system substrate-binding protein